ncbi:hypothetical protein JMJ77_0010731 [Colletotrichum scovillei]|uniref:Uncharacterized protein n=1 Tax=Colletotrichum scovillei TaxID=1209932 RepID=A0A9P7U9D1_9PEZI|nr:hypothetical protein JMJ77_0010731 [Colletotrichum scovillei]KAG7059695.1 hypothetical protein JMJ78_0014984 [Colletotrichum scovillei]KAG7067145.1 hypothetical protein JMJ76_0008588 [Colletotrichum scovillei]
MTAATSNLAQLRDPAGQPWLSGQRSSQQGFENMEEELWILLGPSCLGAEKSSDDKGWLSLRTDILSTDSVSWGESLWIGLATSLLETLRLCSFLPTVEPGRARRRGSSAVGW